MSSDAVSSKFYDHLCLSSCCCDELMFLCSLMVELTVAPTANTSGAELYHQNAEEAYEAAIHAVTSSEGHKAIWKEYVLYMKAKAVTGSCKEFLRLVDCVQRCVMDVSDSADEESSTNSQRCSDYSFHNEVLYHVICVTL